MIKVFRKKSREQITYDGSSMDKAYAWSDLTSDAQSTTGTPPSMTYESSSSTYVAWVAVQLAANTAYTSDYGDIDSVVELYNDSGVKVAQSGWDDAEWTRIPLSYTPTSAGTYYLKFTTSYYEQEWPPTFSFSPRAADPSRPQYTPAETSGGFDAFGFPIGYRSASEAGVAKLSIPTRGLVFYAPLSTGATAAETGQAMDTTGNTFETYKGIPSISLGGESVAVEWTSAIPSGAAPFTLCTWFNASEISSIANGILGIGRRENAKEAVLAVGGNSNFGINHYDVGYDFVTDLTTGAWHFGACTYDGITSTGYLDNASYSKAVNLDILQSIRIGGFTTPDGGSTFPFNGHIAACRVYNRVLSAQELDALSKEFTPTE